LLEREQALNDLVMTHWKNVADMVANGVSLNFSEEDVELGAGDIGLGIPDDSSTSCKRPSRAAARRTRKKRQRANSKNRNNHSTSNSNSLRLTC